MHIDRVCRSVILEIPVNIVREAFDEYFHELVIVENVGAHQRTFDQFVSLLLAAEQMLSYAKSRIFCFFHDDGHLLRVQQAVYSLQIRHDLLFLRATVPVFVLRAVWTCLIRAIGRAAEEAEQQIHRRPSCMSACLHTIRNPIGKGMIVIG